jgi:NMD protein affecting ribosome stability and mRNA decay
MRALEERQRCHECGIPIPAMPEDATYDELLCESCYLKMVRYTIIFGN